MPRSSCIDAWGRINETTSRLLQVDPHKDVKTKEQRSRFQLHFHRLYLANGHQISIYAMGPEQVVTNAVLVTATRMSLSARPNRPCSCIAVPIGCNMDLPALCASDHHVLPLAILGSSWTRPERDNPAILHS